MPRRRRYPRAITIRLSEAQYTALCQSSEVQRFGLSETMRESLYSWLNLGAEIRRMERGGDEGSALLPVLTVDDLPHISSYGDAWEREYDEHNRE